MVRLDELTGKPFILAGENIKVLINLDGNWEYLSANQVLLRAYVIAHQNDQEAFYALVDRLTAKPPTATYYCFNRKA